MSVWAAREGRESKEAGARPEWAREYGKGD